MIELVIYSRPHCHLCDEMKMVVASVVASTRVPATVSEVDISTDPELERRYGLEIPVLIVNGRKAAKYRLSEEELRRILESRAGESGNSGGTGGPGG